MAKQESKTNDSDAPVKLVIVGTLNWLDAAVELVEHAGYQAKAFPIRRYGEAFRFLVSRDFRKSTAVYQRGAGGVKYILACRVLCKPIIKHWIGSDVHRLVDGRGWLRNLKLWIYRKLPAFHMAVNKELAGRLATVGISAGIARTVTKAARAQVEPLPETFTVLSYWTDGRKEFYGGDITVQLAEENPDVRFLVVGTDGEGEDVPPNMEFLGYRDDMPAIYSQCTVLVRMPKTDGAANMPLEMLARGRHVIYNIPFEGCRLANSLEDVRTSLNELGRRPPLNLEGARLVKERYSIAHEAASFRTCFEQWRNRKSRSKPS